MPVMALPTDPSYSTMKPPQAQLFFSALVPAPPLWGDLLQSYDNNEDFEEENDFNRDRDDCAYIYEL